jgi:NAD(P)-dependent dehydrogenase (short-subunit alcohol dehydrogenase family)
VTGGSRGIGRGIALRLASEGAAVAIVARDHDGGRHGRSLESTRTELAAIGQAVAIHFDLSEPGGHDLVDRVERELGPVDILVNNAAQVGFASFLDWSDDDLRAMQEVNVWTPWRLARRVLPGMIQRGGGWIVNVASKASLPTSNVLVGGAAYGGTKAMLVQLTRCLAAELARTGVVANSLTPHGASATEGILEMVGLGRFDERMVEPLEAMAEAALALATAAPGHTNGGLYTSLELLSELGRAVRPLRGGAALAGYDAEQLPARMEEMETTRTRPIDLRVRASASS